MMITSLLFVQFSHSARPPVRPRLWQGPYPPLWRGLCPPLLRGPCPPLWRGPCPPVWRGPCPPASLWSPAGPEDLQCSRVR